MMGYILPIQQDTYRNYQYRIYKQDRTPYEVKEVRVVNFIPIQEDVDFYKQNRNKRMKSTKSEFQSGMVTAYKITPSEEQELSGKGHHVNLKV